jgi:hypothetical protein
VPPLFHDVSVRPARLRDLGSDVPVDREDSPVDLPDVPVDLEAMSEGRKYRPDGWRVVSEHLDRVSELRDVARRRKPDVSVIGKVTSPDEEVLPLQWHVLPVDRQSLPVLLPVLLEAPIRPPGSRGRPPGVLLRREGLRGVKLRVSRRLSFPCIRVDKLAHAASARVPRP